ncbi:ABC transporter substrate-binding protein [Pigmentiphaga soli]|uniref:ABC transporter substrate-binding protein n=1 Tax=Pigmentiphaga soli TaxID=1007095 RepID=A0ABP8H0H2_9BURK
MSSSIVHGTARRRFAWAAAFAAALGLAPAHADPLKIGVILPLTGTGAALGKQMQSAYELALDHLGGKLGGVEVQLVTGDSQSKPDVANRLAEEMIKSSKVPVIVGPLFSNEVMAAYAPIVRSKTFLISPVAGPAPLAGSGCSEYFFNTSSQNDQPAEAMGQYLSDKGAKRLYVMTPNYQGGKDTVAGLQRTYKTPLAGESYTKFGEVEFSSELSTLRAARPDSVFIFYPGAMAVSYLKQYSQAGLIKSVPLYVVWTVDQSSLPAIGDDALGVLGVGMWSVDLDNPANRKFVSGYEARFGMLPNDYAAFAYDAFMLLDSAIRKVGGKVDDKPALRAALKQADFKSVRGNFKFANNGFPVQDYYLREVVKRDDGVLVTKTLSTVMKGIPDSYAKDCKL